MATTILPATDVYFNGSFVDSTRLGDNSDATYVALEKSGVTWDTSSAVITPLASAAGVASIVLHMRLAGSTTGSPTIPLMVTGISAGGGGWDLVDYQFDVPTGSGPFIEYTSAVSPEDVASMAAALTTIPVSVDLTISGTGYVPGNTWIVFVSEVWLEVTTRRKYPLRRHPRSDGYGLGPKRHYPPPETRRHAGGYK